MCRLEIKKKSVLNLKKKLKSVSDILYNTVLMLMSIITKVSFSNYNFMFFV